MKKENEFSCLFGHNITCNGLYQAIRINIVAKKTTELVLLLASFPSAQYEPKKHKSVKYSLSE